MHCITPPYLPPVRDLLRAGRVRLVSALSAPGRRLKNPKGRSRKLRYALCSPRLCAALGRVLPAYGLMETTTPDGTWYRVDSLTIGLTDRVVSLYAGTKAAVPRGLLTLIAATDTVPPDDSPVVPEQGEGIKKCLDYLTNNLHLPYTAAVAFLVLIPEQSGNPETGLGDIAPDIPARFRADCRVLETYNLVSIAGDRVTLTPAGNRIARLIISRYRRAG